MGTWCDEDNLTVNSLLIVWIFAIKKNNSNIKLIKKYVILPSSWLKEKHFKARPEFFLIIFHYLIYHIMVLNRSH